jgi:hypothetical protein
MLRKHVPAPKNLDIKNPRAQYRAAELLAIHSRTPDMKLIRRLAESAQTYDHLSGYPLTDEARRSG